ncbi:MAG: AAA family ATPase [Limisphaerales bacterium]
MRFQRLQIPAFGPFTDLDFQFSALPGDLHVIYGANEAGKSSLLRAIRDLLFGIHGQSTDNFLHDYADLRIKGELRNRAGTQLVFQRRKGNKNTLLNEDGTQLPDNALAPFLGSVDQAYFSAMFGLGTRELQEGAQQLLRGEGNIGNALFSASLGGTPVQKIVEALQQEAERLYKGNARVNVSIRPAATRYKELLKQSRDAMVNPEDWEKLEKELSEAEAAKLLLDAEISKLDRELQWISRCEDALPMVGRLGEEAQKLAQIPPLPDLAGDFTSRAQAARQDVSDAQAKVQGLTASIAKLRIQLQGCQTAPAVLAQADVLDQLHQDFGVYRDRKKSLTDAQARLEGLEPLIRAGMDNLQLAGEFASLENHRLSIPVRLASEEAAGTLKVVLAEQTANSDKAENLETKITAQETELLSLLESNLTGLREALAVAAEATEADRTFLTSQLEVNRLTRETTDLHQQVAGAPVDLDATARLAVPASATIRRYHERLEAFKRAIKSEEDKINEANKRAAAINAELGRLQRQGELPTEEALRQGREHRDHGWSLVLADWKGGGAKEELVPGLPLEEAFPLTIAKADGIADKLRFDAEAVAQAEEKRSQLREIEAQNGACQQKLLELQGDRDGCQKTWQAEWSACGITPRSPLEMEEWREGWIEFRERLGKLRTAEESFKQKGQQIKQAKKSLAAVLGQTEDKEFSLLFAEAKKLVQDGEQSAGQRIELNKQLGGLKSEVAKFKKERVRLAKAVSTSTAKWNAQCAVVGLTEATSPEAGLTLLAERKELLVKFDEWQELSGKSQSTTEAISQYEKNVGTKAAALDIKRDTTEALESALWKALTEARKSQERHDQLAEQIEETTDELTDAQGLATQSEQTLNDLLKLAGLVSVTELEPLLAHLEQRATVQVQIDYLRKTLSGLARGQAVDEFVAKVRAEDPDTLAAREPIAAGEKAEKESALPAIREMLFRLGNEKKTLEKAGDAAADFRQQAESCAATLKQDAARFLRLRLATHLLEAQIEQFRKENQGPLLQKSGEVFQAITRGAFSGLGAEFNADDVPVLVGVRPDQNKVFVEGLSDGSRDQLFLALRLAALDRYLEEHEPMPLILDDLLITFDDERAKAILPQLVALAKRTQILLLTHHEHLVELCRQTLGRDQFHLHHLGRAA